LNVTKLIYNCK